MVLKNISPGCGVRASLMLFLSLSSSEAPASSDHFFGGFLFFLSFCFVSRLSWIVAKRDEYLSLTEIKQQWHLH